MLWESGLLHATAAFPWCLVLDGDGCPAVRWGAGCGALGRLADDGADWLARLSARLADSDPEDLGRHGGGGGGGAPPLPDQEVDDDDDDDDDRGAALQGVRDAERRLRERIRAADRLAAWYAERLRGRVFVLPGDLRNPARAQALVDQAMERLGMATCGHGWVATPQ